MQKSNFREWTLDKVDEAFKTVQVSSLPVLDKLVTFDYSISEYEKHFLKDLSDNFVNFGGDDWNEVELENKIISPIIVLSGMDNKQFAYFLERELATTIDDYELSGKVDGMVATGFRSPKKPYFCMNEYKRGTDPNGDPKGQALIAMLVAQALNENKSPIFGSYIIGRSWCFMALVGKEYAISEDFSCVNNEIVDIYRIMKSLRVQIENILKNE
jgi:hypothetical protein